MDNIKNQYNDIAVKLRQEIGKNVWKKIVFKTLILNENCSNMQTFYFHDTSHNIELGFNNVFAISDAIIIVRDTILKETGKRIWGLTFTLYPNGEYNIKYDYNKPQSLIDAEAQIEEEDEIKDEVSNFFENIQNIGTDDFKLK